MSEDHKIKLACMSLMWGPVDSVEKATGWLDDTALECARASREFIRRGLGV